MTRFFLGLLGSFEVRPASGSPAPAPGKKIQALLAVLGVRAAQSHSRDRLAALLWGEVGQEQARHSVRQALFSIRRMLTEDALVTRGETVTLNPDVVDVDVAQLERLSVTGTVESLDKAAGFYRGDLLEGFRLREPTFEAWLTVERDRIRRQAAAILDQLTEIRLKAGCFDAAIESASRLVALEPTREATHRTLIRLYLETGRRAAAIRQYRACERVLSADLGVEPDDETRALYEKVLQTRGLAAPQPNGQSHRAAILIVEDEPVTRAVLEGFLGMAGYDTTAASDGADALFQLRGRQFDLIVSDIAMPKLDGLGLAEIVARKGLQTPVIFITGKPGDELEVKGLEMGAVDFIRKPLQKDVLLLRVRKALRAG